MNKEIYIIRHAETDYNKNGLIQGKGVDEELNDTGRSQSKMFYESYKNTSFEKIYISGLKRTYQTIEPFIFYKNIPYERLSGLNEMGWGIHEGKSVDKVKEEIHGELLVAWYQGNLEKKVTNGESLQEVQQRLDEAIKYILTKQKEKIILICMHGRVMRILFCMLLNLPLHKMDQFPHQNLSLYKLLYNGKSFVLKEHNNIDHLEK